jgi:hypothetical protein
MKNWTMAALVAGLAVSGVMRVSAHEGGHGPMMMEQGEQGGVLSLVIEKGKQSATYRGELVRSQDGTVRFYLYDVSMLPVKMEEFGPSAKGVVVTKKKGKVGKVSFPLTLQDGAFVGKAPAVAAKPFTIEVVLKQGTLEFLAVFKNLD